MKRTLILLAAGLTLSGCVVGPNYVSPAPKAPAQGDLSQASAAGFVADEPPADWWRLFNDPAIERLVNEALAANTDLRVAAANLRQARAVLRETRSARLPSTTVNAQGGYGQVSGSTLGIDGPGPRGDSYQASFDVGYQVDLFGKITRAIQAGRADVEASQAAYDLARVTVVAETIRAYSDACAAGQQLAVSAQTLKLQEDTFDLTRRLEAGGRGTGLQTSQGQALLEQTRSTVPLYEAQRKAALFRLAVLTGKPPAEFPADAAACNTPPVVKQAIPVGNGATLLARRADVRAAERRLASATAQVGVATADLYPNISIGGSIGSTANSPEGLFKSSGLNFSIGPLLSFSFPNMSVARARIAQARAGADAALATFDGTWLTALQDVETSLAAYVAAGQQVEALRRAREASGEAARIARLRYRSGAEAFQTVLDAERTQASNELLLAQAESGFSDATITLFLALGGGWQQPPQG
ncbi:efflux transporter outer membrane subunit [Sphingomonas sp. HITSZ_GF]|uniref:efflux transporter outer membrane subunit n=1 Tax=Sphingomonas sp. HITSZ_GF TaxID=3037247 RepID=UPI00240E47F6|nr:efflux transporter outer membrane subunit [Sphingomonas sp. HITSZ_GF]MDG2535567.1 efflux transporter outer membrane subunit [Sphingomonas sp. HITSZ_GF]